MAAMFGKDKKVNTTSSKMLPKKGDCGLTQKECNGQGMKVGERVIGKCLKCPLYKKN